MKWREFYLDLKLFVDRSDASTSQYGRYQPWPKTGLPDVFKRMLSGDSFPFELVIDYLATGKIVVCVPVQLIVLGITMLPEMRIQITVKTVGKIPPGMRRGTYVIPFDDIGACCEEASPFPAEMFEDGEVPEDMIPVSRRARLGGCAKKARCFEVRYPEGKASLHSLSERSYGAFLYFVNESGAETLLMSAHNPACMADSFNDVQTRRVARNVDDPPAPVDEHRLLRVHEHELQGGGYLYQGGVVTSWLAFCGNYSVAKETPHELRPRIVELLAQARPSSAVAHPM